MCAGGGATWACQKLQQDKTRACCNKIRRRARETTPDRLLLGRNRQGYYFGRIFGRSVHSKEETARFSVGWFTAFSGDLQRGRHAIWGGRAKAGQWGAGNELPAGASQTKQTNRCPGPVLHLFTTSTHRSQKTQLRTWPLLPLPFSITGKAWRTLLSHLLPPATDSDRRALPRPSSPKWRVSAST